MKLLLAAAVLLLYAAGPQCETRPAGSDAGFDAGRRPGDAGSGDNGWDPNLPDGGFPGSGRNGDPGTQLVFVVNVDRGLANDAALYQRLVDQVRAALAHSGLKVVETGVASLQEGQLLWAQSRDTAPPVKLAQVLSFYAERRPDTQASCSTAGLATLGSNMPFTQLAYPAELTGVPRFEQPFMSRPGALLVVMIDHDVRPATTTSISCDMSGQSPAEWYGSDPSSQWLWWRLPRPTTRFWVISTPEDGTVPDAMRATCLAGGFQPSALDVIAPSSVPFYDPWAGGMNLYFPGLMERADFCASMAGALPAQAWADDWAKVLRAQVGLP